MIENVESGSVKIGSRWVDVLNGLDLDGDIDKLDQIDPLTYQFDDSELKSTKSQKNVEVETGEGDLAEREFVADQEELGNGEIVVGDQVIGGCGDGNNPGVWEKVRSWWGKKMGRE